MPETINWSFSVGVVEGPKLGGSDSLAVGAYDKASVTVAVGANLDVQVHRANARDKVQPLALQASAACGRRAPTVPSSARATALPAGCAYPSSRLGAGRSHLTPSAGGRIGRSETRVGRRS